MINTLLGFSFIFFMLAMFLCFDETIEGKTKLKTFLFILFCVLFLTLAFVASIININY